MRIALPVALLCGLLSSRGAEAQEANIQHPRWVIVETIIDRATGKQLHVTRLDDPNLRFENLARCQSIVDKFQPPVNTPMTFVLECKKISPKSEYL